MGMIPATTSREERDGDGTRSLGQHRARREATATAGPPATGAPTAEATPAGRHCLWPSASAQRSRGGAGCSGDTRVAAE